MAKQTGLGRGFETLIPTSIQNEFEKAEEAVGDESRTLELLIQDIKTNPEQPRKSHSAKSLSELVESIKVHGVIQPIVVRTSGKKYMIIAGERRWRAAKKAGLTQIPAVIRTPSDQENIELAVIENIQREDLSPLETAAAYLKLRQQFDLTFEQIAKRVGKAGPTVHNMIRLLSLSEPAKRALQEGRISTGHARTILGLKDEQKQQELLDLIVRHGWNVRQAEQFVVNYKNKDADKNVASKSTRTETKETKAISSYVKSPVRLQRLAHGGRIVIDYKDDDDLARITGMLSN